MSSPLLRSLRLNCLLVPALVVLIAVVAVWAAWWRAEEAAGGRIRDEAGAALAALARAFPQGDPALVRAADPRWTGIARVSWHDDRLTILAQAGTVRLRADDPPPDLVLAVHGGMAWSDGPAWLIAGAPLSRSGHQGCDLLYGERPAVPPDPTTPLTASAILVLLGGALGWYLAARVYRPIEWMAQEAAAALEGRPATGSERSSVETEAMRSSMTLLVQRYRSGQHAPVAPRADAGTDGNA